MSDELPLSARRGRSLTRGRGLKLLIVLGIAALSGRSLTRGRGLKHACRDVSFLGDTVARSRAGVD